MNRAALVAVFRSFLKAQLAETFGDWNLNHIGAVSAVITLLESCLLTLLERIVGSFPIPKHPFQLNPSSDIILLIAFPRTTSQSTQTHVYRQL